MTSTSLPYSPAAERNREPILASLQALLPESASVLEIAAGTGQHAEHFAGANPRWRWLPTDAKQDLFAGIAARTAALPNVAAPQVLDVTRWQPAPGFGPFDAVYCANMLHASPWATCAGLMRVAADALAPAGLLLVYGPFIVAGEPTAASNLEFDADLRSRDASWGLRRLEDIEHQARSVGLRLAQRLALPSNNQLLVFRRES